MLRHAIVIRHDNIFFGGALDLRLAADAAHVRTGAEKDEGDLGGYIYIYIYM